MPDLSCVAVTSFRRRDGCRPENKNGPCPATTGWTTKRYSSTRSRRCSAAESLGLPTSSPRGVAFFTAFTARARSPSPGCVLFHEKSRRVVETTYLGLASSFFAQFRFDGVGFGSRATRGQGVSLRSEVP